MRLALARRLDSLGFPASFRAAVAKSGLTEKPVSSQSARAQRSPRDGVHTQEAYQDPQKEYEQQQAQATSQLEGGRPTLSDAQSNEVLLGSPGEADLEALHVQSCPVTGQLPLTADKQAPLPVIAEEVSCGGDSSTPAAGEEGYGLPSFGTEVSADVDRKGMEIQQLKELLGSRQAQNHPGERKPLLRKAKRAEQEVKTNLADEQQDFDASSMLATTAHQVVAPQASDQSSRAKSASNAKSKGRAKGNGGSSASLKPATSLRSKGPPPPVKAAPRKGSLPGGAMEGKILSYREAKQEDKMIADQRAAALPPVQEDDDGLEDFISFCDHGSSWLGPTSLPIKHVSSSARGREVMRMHRSAMLNREEQRKFEAAQSRGVAAYVVAMAPHPADVIVHANPNNIEGALDDPGRKFKFLAPRADERMDRPKEVWKYDLHTSEYMRRVLRLTLRPEDAADAMSF